ARRPPRHALHVGRGFYKMDRAKLEARLRRAKLVIGNVSETTKDFFAKHKPAPIACVMFDLDYHSSTVDALKLFDGGPETRLPRVYAYFDDIASGALRANNSHVGVLRAIEDFNDASDDRKVAKIAGLSTSRRIPASWHEHM